MPTGKLAGILTHYVMPLDHAPRRDYQMIDEDRFDNPLPGRRRVRIAARPSDRDPIAIRSQCALRRLTGRIVLPVRYHTAHVE
jgi:hypothetical protein